MTNQLEVTCPVDGELVKCDFILTGKTAPGRTVTVVVGNEKQSVKVDGQGIFSVPVHAAEIHNEVTVSDDSGESMTIRFVCDHDTRKRYNFFIDDNVFWLTELVRQNHKSIFDNFYMNNLRTLHKRYGIKVTLNTFYHNWHEGTFTTAELDDRYKSEFADNADWLRLAIHSYSEFPEYPYSKVYPEKLPEHHKLISGEIKRYAGERSYIEPVLMHYYGISSAESRKYIADAGMNCFCQPAEYWNELFEKIGRKIPAKFNYEFNQLEIQLLTMINFFPAAQLLSLLEKAYAENDRDFLLVGDHEQYSYPFYSAYQPDHFERMDAVFRSLTEHGYEPVYFTETLLK